MLIISTTNQILAQDAAGDQKVLLRKKRGFFQRRSSTGFFGLAVDQATGDVLIAARVELGTKKIAKHGSDVRLFHLNPRSLKIYQDHDIHDVHDVHQIAASEGILYLTDTGKNRIVVFDLRSKRVLGHLLVGSERRDIHHINAVKVDKRENRLLVGLNNRGEKDSEILVFNLDQLPSTDHFVLDILELGDLLRLDGLSHTHDIEIFQDKVLVCSSHQGRVFQTRPMRDLLHVGDWARGLAIASGKIWVGVSALAERDQRHREDLDGELHCYDSQSFECLGKWTLRGAGQVNDIIALGD